MMKNGQMINSRYQILQEIGSGGIGKVLKATDVLKESTVAIKVLLSQESEHLERFKNEFLLLRKLNHPNIVKVYDFGFTEAGEAYFTMEYIQGNDWKLFFQPLDYSKFWQVMLQVFTTLDFLHSKRIIHGDLKPSNILINTSPDGQATVKFTDFGFAEYEKTEEAFQWKGTLSYLAPEIIRGEKKGPQADLYSVGILIYESVFGKPPFDQEDLMALAKSHLEEDVVIPEEPSIPILLKNLILRLLEKDPIDRFFSAQEVLEEVQKISGLTLQTPEAFLARSLVNSADFVGREKELGFLREALNQVAEEGNRFVLLTGESGVGKTSLADEFSAWAQLHAFRAINVSLKEARTFEAFRDSGLRFLDRISGPWVLIFEHLELADDPFLEFLSGFVSRTRENQILFCFTLTNEPASPEENRRTEEIGKRLRSICGDSLISIKLNRLTDAEARKMFCSMFSCREPAEKITAPIQQETKGNPFLIAQLMESLEEEGKIRRQNDKWLMEADWVEKSKIPQSVKNQIERRLAFLEPESAELLGRASVCSLELEFDVLMQLSGLDHAVLSACLNQIISRGLMEESSTADKRRFRFVNNLFRRFVYDQTDPDKRKTLHQKTGEVLERNISLDTETHVYQLANQFYRSGDVKRALKYALLAAQGAESRCEYAQAISHYLNSLELYDKIPALCPRSREDILESLADQFDLMGELERSLNTYQEALRIWNSRASNHEKPALIYRKMGRVYEKMSEHQKAVECLEESLQRFKAIGSPKNRARTLVNLGWVQLKKSDYGKARSRFEEALNILRKEATSKEMGFALSGLGSIHWTQGDYSQAGRCHRESLKVFEELGDKKKMADCYGNLAIVARSRGELNEAIDYFRKCLDLLETLQDQYRLSILHNHLSLAYLGLNQWHKALECLWKACEFQEKISDSIGLGFSYNNIGLIHLRRGELCRALEYFNLAVARFQAARQKGGLALAYFNLADLNARREEFDQASGYFKKSLGIREELGEEAGIADCLALLGRVLLQQSAFDQAKQNLVLAQNLYQKQVNKKAEVEVVLCLAELAIKTGESGPAETHLEQVKKFLQQLDNKFLEASFQRVKASLAKARGDAHGSLECLSESAKTFRKLQARLELGQTYLEMGKIKLELKRWKEAKGFFRQASSIFEREKIEPRQKEVESLSEQMKDLKILESERTRTFYQLAELLNNIWDTDELLAKSLELTMQLLNAQRGAVIFYSDQDQSFEVKVSRGIEKETSQDAVAISRQVLNEVVEGGSPLIVEDAKKDPAFAKSQSVIMHNILSILCVPLKTKDRLIGTVYLDHRELPAMFSSEDVDFLKAFANLIATAVEKSELYVKANQELFQLKEALHHTYEYPGVVGKSAKMQQVFNTVEKVADSRTGVLILGENGTGKEVIANLIHTRSGRKDGSFIKVNCAALPETLLESELFGIEEKTATGVGFRKGKFELANGGTIFLDEIGDMNLSVQAKVLRVIEEKEFERVGGQKSVKVDVRVISATNMDLHKKIEEGSFRKDLYFRLNPIVITIPPLRERKEDIPFLIDYFLRKFSQDSNEPPIRLTRRIIEALKEHSWPGNVRELEHLIESAILLNEDGAFPESLLPKEVRKSKTGVNLEKYGKLQEVLDWVEKRKILQALDENGWNQSHAAEDLGISEPTLRRRMKRYDLKRTVRVHSS